MACAGSGTSDCSVQGGPQMAAKPPATTSVPLGQSTVTGSTNRLDGAIQNAISWWNKTHQDVTCGDPNGYAGPCSTAWLFGCTPGASIWQGGCTPGQLADQMEFAQHLCAPGSQLTCQLPTFGSYLSAATKSG